MGLRLLAEDVHFVLVQAFVTATRIGVLQLLFSVEPHSSLSIVITFNFVFELQIVLPHNTMTV
jgi:hypothetical protein